MDLKWRKHQKNRAKFGDIDIDFLKFSCYNIYYYGYLRLNQSFWLNLG